MFNFLFNKGKQPIHSLTPDDVTKVVIFIKNYAEDHAIMLPGRIPGLKEYENKQILPSKTTKREVHLAYKHSLRGPCRVVSLPHFNYRWRRYSPYVIIGKPMSDLCWVCQKNSIALARTPIERQSEVNTCYMCQLMF